MIAQVSPEGEVMPKGEVKRTRAKAEASASPARSRATSPLVASTVGSPQGAAVAGLAASRARVTQVHNLLDMVLADPRVKSEELQEFFMRIDLVMHVRAMDVSNVAQKIVQATRK